jgi:hypothetical protein
VKVFHCDHCGQLLFFENINCVRCGRALAYVPQLGHLMSLDLRPSGTDLNAQAGDAPKLWTSPLAMGTAFKLCQNYSRHNVCNWALPEDDPNDLCRACRLTKTIPNLSRPGNDRLWYQLEVAKRRLVYTIDQLGLPLRNATEDPTGGLAFEFLEDPDPNTQSNEPKVMTGHNNGVVTINIAEADEAERVKRRLALNEPYRTVLGHFRHEIGHYYWDRLVRDSERRLHAFRDLFGDERADYQAAIQRYYKDGPLLGWQNSHVTAYATMHPWEDWAETWAHYLHMTDTLETAAATGISIEPPRADEPTLTEVPNPIDDKVSFDKMLDSWGPITYVLNNLNRGLGIGDAYPFVLSTTSINKLRFVHDTIVSVANR